MKLNHEFIKLPLMFDVAQMQYEVNQFSIDDWQPHHEKFIGNSAIPLISVNGGKNNTFKGKMLPTQALKQSKYLLQVLASFNQVFGRSRLMLLEPKCEVPLHSDINYYWYNRVRIHIPIITDPNVIFHCGDKHVHMKEGESWIFDSWKNHKVANNSEVTRIHLVIDTSGSADFWKMINKAYVPWLHNNEKQTKFVEYNQNIETSIKTELFNSPVVMCPGELDGMIGEVRSEILHSNNDESLIKELNGILSEFSYEWRQLWSCYGANKDGWSSYHQCRDKTFHKAKHSGSQLKISNQGSALQMLIHCIIDPALNPEVA